MKDESPIDASNKNKFLGSTPPSINRNPAFISQESPAYCKVSSNSSVESDLECSTKEREEDNCYVLVDTVETRSKNKNIILYPMVASLESQNVTAIIGPKESGKTMLMNFMMGSLPRKNIFARGEVKLSGSKAFVPKDDHMHGFYTCYSYMWHYLYLSRSRMRNRENNSTPTEDEDEIISLLHSLGLDEDKIVGDYVISGLNTGEKRRLHLALIALSKPQTIFLEEPFANIDVENSLIIMKFLKDYVQKGSGRKVILTVSHPNSSMWQMIDRVILLSRGQLIYEGQKKKMDYFFVANGCRIPPGYNPADHYVSVVNEDSQLSTRMVKEWVSAFEIWKLSGESNTRRRMSDTSTARRTIENRRTILIRTLSSRKGLSELSKRLKCSIGFIQFRAHASILVELTLRYVSSLSFHPMLLLWRGQMTIASNFLIGILFWNMQGDEGYFKEKDVHSFIQSRILLVQIIMSSLVFCTTVTIYPFIFQERYIVTKDIQNGYYNPTQYQIAWGVSSFASSVVISIITTSILVLMLGSDAFEDAMTFYLCMVLFTFCTEALMQFVCVCVATIVDCGFSLGLAFLAWTNGFFILLQGFHLFSPSLLPDWLETANYATYFAYSYRVFMSSMHFPVSISHLRQFDINVNEFDLTSLALYAIGLHLLTLVVLWVQHWKSNAKTISYH